MFLKEINMYNLQNSSNNFVFDFHQPALIRVRVNFAQ